MANRTPPRLPATFLKEETLETPGPQKARIKYLEGQASQLVRANQTLERKREKEKADWEKLVKEKTRETDEVKTALNGSQKELQRAKRDLERCVAEGEGMREILQLHSTIEQQKAHLALVQEQMNVAELERRLNSAEQERLMRDHKIALFQAKEQDLAAEIEEKDAHIDDLEAALSEANTSLAHERAAALKASSLSASSTKGLSEVHAELSTAHSEIAALELKVEALEIKVRGLKESEKEARSELRNWLREEASASKSKEKDTELQAQLRGLKAEVRRKEEEVEQVREELEEARKSNKEREKVLKGKLKDAVEERENLAGAEEEPEALKAAGRASPKKSRVRKASPAADDDVEDVVPTKKPRKADSPKKTKAKASAKATPDVDSGSEPDAPLPKKASSKPRAKSPTKPKKSAVPLEESDADNQPPPTKAKSGKGKQVEEAEDEEEKAGAGGKKKKKRLLKGAVSTFAWDPVLNSGDGVIPSFLSPARPGGGKAAGTIPRAGFASMASSSRLNRFG